MNEPYKDILGKENFFYPTAVEAIKAIVSLEHLKPADKLSGILSVLEMLERALNEPEKAKAAERYELSSGKGKISN